MISNKLHEIFSILETAIFPVWEKSNDKDRENITKKLGEREAEMILDEITNEVINRSMIQSKVILDENLNIIKYEK